MPIGPASIPALLDVYDDLVNGAEDLAGAAARVAPAAAREILCQAGGLASLGAGPFGSRQSPGSGNRTLSDLGGILQAACPMPPEVPQPPSPPFEGGQCPGILYTVRTNLKRQNLDNCNEFETAFDVGNVPGPVGQPFPVEFIENPCNNGEIGRVWNWTTGAGTVLFRSEAGNVGLQEVEVLEVIRQDGLPDDCGSPEPPPPEPRPPIVQPPRSPEIPTVDPDGNPGSPIFLEPVIGPIYITPDGGISIPVVVNIDGPDIDIPISIPVSVSLPDFNPTFNFGGSGGGTGGGGGEPSPPQGICCEPPPPEVRPASPEDPDEPPEDEPEEFEKIVAVTIVSAPTSGRSQASVYFSASPPLLVPRIATVQFEVAVGGSTYLSPEQDVKTQRQIIEAPEYGEVTRAFVGWEPGWDGSFEYLVELRNGLP